MDLSNFIVCIIIQCFASTQDIEFLLVTDFNTRDLSEWFNEQ